MKSEIEKSSLKKKLADHLINDQNIMLFRNNLTCVENDMEVFKKSVNEQEFDEYKRNILLNKDHLKSGYQKNDRAFSEIKHVFDLLVSNNEFKTKINYAIKKASSITPRINSSIKPLQDSIESMLNLRDSDFFIRGTIQPPWHQFNEVLAKYLLLKEEYEIKFRHEYSLIENKEKCIKIQ